MALFQKSVLNKYLKLQDATLIDKAYKKFCKYFHNPKIQQNILVSKEEQFQQKFLIELFEKVFDYTIFPDEKYNITTEFKNLRGAKKADGAILVDGKALCVIELKGTNTKDLESIRQQAFDYKSNHPTCKYIITSNFEKIRFYIETSDELEEFNLFTLTKKEFELLYLCIHKDNLLNNIPLSIKKDSIVVEESITKKFYNDYSLFKRELFRDLVKQNLKNEVFRTELQKEDTDTAKKKIKLSLFKKSQKLIDRFLFIFFAEDRGLLPPNSTIKILKDWNKLAELDAEVPLYNRFKLYFKYLDQGRAGTNKKAEIFAYNGGLFKPDPILDSIILDDSLLYKHTKALSEYDFESQVDVNILGHIFENSLNEIESVNAEIEGADFDKQKTKRKKDGVFYTPKYITKYIVDNTIGKLCNEKKAEFTIIEKDFTPNRQTATKRKLLSSLENYREWLLQITICDPACGSGAFLNQALDFLIKEHTFIDELQTKLLGGGFVFPNIENTVLENNIFGVDLNEESVEIAKLSLWLRTAQPRRKLNSLNNNIKCGNSLIDSKAVAGDKAFTWETEFKQVFEKGGFDVVIGNPPWNSKISPNDSKEIALKYNLELKNLNYICGIFLFSSFNN
ncbi:MAG: DNA methyltransferase [Polaribacter sp.]|uniref:Eco57I restriction-modification methylase domain-containing protein n=1 Tax=Polaribacter sp. TaxID=1920175 RepID=UPI002F35697A